MDVQAQVGGSVFGLLCGHGDPLDLLGDPDAWSSTSGKLVLDDPDGSNHGSGAVCSVARHAAPATKSSMCGRMPTSAKSTTSTSEVEVKI